MKTKRGKRLDSARLMTLKSLYELADGRQEVYHTRSNIAIGVETERDNFGKVYPTDVPDLLKSYIEQGLVEAAEVQQTIAGTTEFYRVNTSREKDIRKLLRGLKRR